MVPTSQIRIIGGKWRGRKINVPDLLGLRPTPNRVRETLFNWLMNIVVRSRCLDLFAGTGALGFEALSRGAESVVMVDQSKAVVDQLQQEIILFKTDKVDVLLESVPNQLIFEKLKQSNKTFDIVFLDPPYGKNLLLPTCFLLEENNMLSNQAYIYLEDDSLVPNEALPLGWKIIKSKQAGHVFYHLVFREKPHNE